MNATQWRQDLVLVGGGHAHALVLRMLAMRPLAHTRITLVSLADHTPYSGMLPGQVAGHYQFAETHIDLRKFCSRIGVRFIKARACGLDLSRHCVELVGRPALPFDALSLDIGSQPGLARTEGALQYAIPVKPVHDFHQRWLALEQRLLSLPDDRELQLVLVGGGAGSVELAFAMRYRIQHPGVRIKLVCGSSLLETYNARTRATVRKHCAAQAIEVIEQAMVTAVHDRSLIIAGQPQQSFDELFWCTAAVAETWLADTGLACDERGFLQVRDTLQVMQFDNIFAAGDVASQVNHPRPKAGVYAVRQAPVLAHNLGALLQNRPLRQFRPQHRFLSLLSLGDKVAVAERGPFSASGKWVWRWKHHIDHAFMNKFTDLPAQMPAPVSTDEVVMHCGGCGAKVPAQLLRESLAELARQFPATVDANCAVDDAAVIDFPSQHRLVQSVDVLRALVDDPWLMGRIAVLHALSDLYAMGATPHSALASLTIAYAGAAIQQRDFSQLMGGAVLELERAGCQLLGGHTMEGPELALGFTVNGVLQERLLEKSALQLGDRLVLCKPLGTGVLFAAQQQGLARGDWIGAALDAMLLSNAAAATIALQAGARAATDITGFGLLGHLQEMLPGAALQARLELQRVPLLDGVVSCFEMGVASTLQPGNIDSVRQRLAPLSNLLDARMQALFDPQTCGGLLLALPPGNVDNTVQQLHAAGYAAAAEIGEVVASVNDAHTVLYVAT